MAPPVGAIQCPLCRAYLESWDALAFHANVQHNMLLNYGRDGARIEALTLLNQREPLRQPGERPASVPSVMAPWPHPSSTDWRHRPPPALPPKITTTKWKRPLLCHFCKDELWSYESLCAHDKQHKEEAEHSNTKHTKRTSGGGDDGLSAGPSRPPKHSAKHPGVTGSGRPKTAAAKTKQLDASSPATEMPQQPSDELTFLNPLTCSVCGYKMQHFNDISAHLQVHNTDYGKDRDRAESLFQPTRDTTHSTRAKFDWRESGPIGPLPQLNKEDLIDSVAQVAAMFYANLENENQRKKATQAPKQASSVARQLDWSGSPHAKQFFDEMLLRIKANQGGRDSKAVDAQRQRESPSPTVARVPLPKREKSKSSMTVSSHSKATKLNIHAPAFVPRETKPGTSKPVEEMTTSSEEE